MPAFGGDEYLRKLVLNLVDGGATAFVETGTYKGSTCAWLGAHRALPIFTCEIDAAFAAEARKTLPGTTQLHRMSSEKFIPHIKGEVGNLPLFYLDAHWRDYWPILDELRGIGRHYASAIAILHDFKVPSRDCFSYTKGGGGSLRFHRAGRLNPPLDLDYVASILRENAKRHRLSLFFPDYFARVPGYLVVFQDTKPFGLAPELYAEAHLP
jgi:hypothetical protein